MLPRHFLRFFAVALVLVAVFSAREIARHSRAQSPRRPVAGPAPGHPAQPGSMRPMGKAAGKIPNDWFHIQRAWPGTEISAAARELALEEARSQRVREEQGRDQGKARVADWAQAGPLNIGGRITAIAVHPQMPNRIFAGAADGGIFVSSDGGTNWAAVFDAIGNLSIGALAFDPSNPQVLYAGTGEANASGDSFAGIGVFRTTDGGVSWSSVGLPDSRHINRIVVDPADNRRVYVAAMGALFSKSPDRGLYRTTNGGQSWERRLFVSDSTGVIDVVQDPTEPSRLFAATWERMRTPQNRHAGGITSGVYRSTDRGDTWSLLAGGLPGPSVNIGRIGLALAASQPQTVYAIYADDVGYFAGLYKTTNGGDTWTRTSDSALSDLYSSYGWYFGNVRVDPTNPNKVYAMGLDIYRSTNGSSGWSYLSSGVHVDQHDLWIDPLQPNRLLAGGDGGLYISTNGGSFWSHVETLPITQFYAGAIDNLNPQRIYGGSQDNGTVRTWTGGLSDWTMIYGGDGFYCLVDPRNSNIIFAEYQYGNLARSLNGGASFSSCVSGINSNDRRNWSTPVVFDPVNPDRMYYGTYRLYRTTNAAGSWSSISPDLTGGQGNGNLIYGTITTIAAALSNSQVIYVGTDDARVWRTTTGGGGWLNISAGLPQRWVTRVAVDPTNADVAYVAHSGYREDSPLAHLHRTTDGGATWTAIDAGLPEAPVNAVVVDPNHPEVLYVGSDVGVYWSPDSGQSWGELAGGLPIAVIDDLVLHAPTGALVAFTHGRSAYRATVPDLSGVVADGNGPLGSSGLASARPALLPPRPNPFGGASGGRTTIGFRIPAGSIGGAWNLGIYDAGGRLCRRLHMAAEIREGEVDFDGRDDSGRLLPAGAYFARIAGPAGSASARVVIAR